MQASKLIELLQEAVAKYGDLECHYGDDYCLSVTLCDYTGGENENLSIELS